MLDISHPGPFVWISFGLFRLEAFNWHLPLGNFRFASFACELSLGSLGKSADAHRGTPTRCVIGSSRGKGCGWEAEQSFNQQSCQPIYHANNRSSKHCTFAHLHIAHFIDVTRNPRGISGWAPLSAHSVPHLDDFEFQLSCGSSAC